MDNPNEMLITMSKVVGGSKINLCFTFEDIYKYIRDRNKREENKLHEQELTEEINNFYDNFRINS